MVSITVLLCFVGLVFLMVAVIVASSIRIVREGTRLSVYRLGQYLGDKGPGLVILIPFIDRGILKEVDTPEQSPVRAQPPTR